MSNYLIVMAKVRTIIELYAQGVSKKSICQKTGVSRNTVKKYIRDFISIGRTLEDLLKLTDTELEQLFSVVTVAVDDSKSKVLESLFPEIEKELKKPGVTRRHQWEKYIRMHPDGYRLSQFKLRYNQWIRKANTVMHIEHKAGDKVYVDYAGQKLRLVDPATGEIKPVEVFVAILGASQYTYVEATMTQQKEDFIEACENALHYFGGVPQAIVTDNLKSAVIKSSKYEPTLGEAFKGFVEHYRMTALPAGPYKPRHKALVEGAVKIIYQTIYTGLQERTFSSREDLNKAIMESLAKHNDRLLSGRPYSRKQLFEEIEMKVLQPLPVYRYELRNKRTVTAMKNNHVCLKEDKHYYSVPYRYVGKKVRMLYSQSLVEIFHRYECIARHQRNYRPYGYTTVEDHLASKHQYQSDWTPEKFLEKASFIGEETKQYIFAILEKRQHPEQAFRSCQGILSFVARVGKERLNAACRRAGYFGDYSFGTIKTILEKKLDQVPFEQDGEQKMPPHNNIRGNEYYC